jgi:hypothetical protein
VNEGFVPRKSFAEFVPLRAAKRRQGWKRRPNVCGSGCRYYQPPQKATAVKTSKKGKCLLGGFLTNHRAVCDRWDDTPFIDLGNLS